MKRPLLCLTGGFVLGEVLILQGRVALELIMAVLLPVMIGAFVCGPCRRMIRRSDADQRSREYNDSVRKGRSLWLWLLPVFVLAGGVRAHQVQANCERELGYGLDGAYLCVTGKAADRNLSGTWTVLVLEDVRIEQGPYSGEMLGQLQVYLPLDMELEAPMAVGNHLTIWGECTAFEPDRNPGEFDFRLYYRSMKLNYRIFGERCRIVDGHQDVYRETLRRIAVRAGTVLDQAAGEDAGIFRALMLGDKADLPEEVRRLYQENGIAHLLAISGLHLSLVSLAVYGLCRKLGAGFGLAGMLGGGVLVSYAFLAGGSPSLIRALIMALCGFLAAYLGRTYDLLTALGLAGLCLLWDSPYRICQAGVQLSFGALFGIGAAAPALERLAAEEGAGKPAVSGMSVSLGMQLVSLPAVLFHFFQYPLYGIFLNLVTVPLMGIVVASGTAGVVLGSVFSVAAGQFAAGAGRLILAWYAWCCHLFERLPGSRMILGRPEFWQIGLYYGSLVTALWLPPRFSGRKVRTRRSAGVRVLLVLIAAVMLFPISRSGLTVTFLDVGQGDGICLQTRQGTLLVDGGSTDQKKLGENRLEPFLKSQGIRRVDYAVVSHGDQDHVSGLVYLMEQDTGIAVQNLVLPAAGRGDESCQKLEALAVKHGSRVIWMQAGDCITMGSLTLQCLYPESGFQSEDRNEHSLALLASFGERRLMLTGDMSREGEKRLLQQLEERGMTENIKNIDVLKAAHHGSDSASSEEWLDVLNPDYAVVSYGEGNRYGHPHIQVLDRLRERQVTLYQTGEGGAVMLYTDGRKLRWSQWLEP